MPDIENLAAIVAAMRSYKQNLRTGRGDLAQADYDRVMQGIEALKGLTGIKETQQRMTIERAEEAHREALRPKELRGKEAAVSTQETELKEMQLDLEEKEKTIQALQKQLADLGMPGTTPEALQTGEVLREVIARVQEGVPEAKATAQRKALGVEELTSELARRIGAERLERGVPEKTVAAELVELETGRRRGLYEQTTLDYLEEQNVPLAEARRKSMEAAKALDVIDAQVKLMKAQARRARAESDRIGFEIGADDALREAYRQSGIDFNDILVTKSKIEQGLWPRVNETLQNLEDGMRIYSMIKSRPPGQVDPITLAASTTMPRVASMLKEFMPNKEDKEAALGRMEEYINLQKSILRQSGLDYDSLVESTQVYTREDLEGIRSELALSYTDAEGLTSIEITDYLDTLGLRLLNDPDVMRDQVLAAIEQNRTAGFNLDTLYGADNVQKFFSLLQAVQGIIEGQTRQGATSP